MSFSLRIYARGLYFMDFLKLMRFRLLMRYCLRSSRAPTSCKMVPFGSVTTYEEWHWSRLGLTKNRVLPLPDPPMTRIFLFRAYLGSLGRLDMVIRSVWVRRTFWEKSLST